MNSTTNWFCVFGPNDEMNRRAELSKCLGMKSGKEVVASVLPFH